MMTETYTIQDIAGMTGLNERTIRTASVAAPLLYYLTYVQNTSHPCP